MTNYLKFSQLNTTTSSANTDKIVILSNPDTSPILQTIRISDIEQTIGQAFANVTSPVISGNLVVNSTFTANSLGIYGKLITANNILVTNSVTIQNSLSVATKIQVGAQVGYNFGTAALIEIDANSNTYQQVVIQNANTGNNASGDLVITADSGNDSVNYVDFGINSSTYNQPQFGLTGPLDAYLYSSNSNLVIGTASAKEIVFHAGGVAASNRKLTVNSSAVVIANSSALIANGSPGAAGWTLTSNGTGIYWASDDDSMYALLSGATFTGNVVVGNAQSNAATTNTSFVISNSSTNTAVTSSSIAISNSTTNTAVTSSSIAISNSSTNTAVTSSSISIGNTIQNTVVTATGITTNGIIYPNLITMLTYQLAF